jgi:outer membrane protein
VTWWVGAALAATPELHLDQAMQLALAQNPDVRSASLGQLVADIDASRARLDRLTATVSATAGGDTAVVRPWGEPAFATSDAAWDTRVTLGVPLYTGGALRAAIDRADAGAAIAALDLELTDRDVVRAAYTAYWNIKGYELRIGAAEEGLAVTREALDIIRSKADAGLAAGIDVNRSTVDLYAQQEGLLAERAALAQAQQELIRLLHLDAEAVVLLDEPPAAVAGPIALPALAGMERAELRRQEMYQSQAGADVRAARAGALPTVSLSATAGAGSSALGGGAIGAPALDPQDLRPALDAGIGAQLSWSPFDLWRTRDAVRQAQLVQRQVDLATESVEDQITAEVRTAAANLSALRERAPLVGEQVALARDNLQIVQDLYAQGSASILDLFDAQSAFRQARIGQAGLGVQLATAEYDLRWSLGEDLVPAPGASR